LRFPLFFAHSWLSVAPPHEDNDYEDASFLEVISVIDADALEIQIQKGEFLVPLDTLRRTPVTKEELLSSTHRFHSQQDQRMISCPVERPRFLYGRVRQQYLPTISHLKNPPRPGYYG